MESLRTLARSPSEGEPRTLEKPARGSGPRTVAAARSQVTPRVPRRPAGAAPARAAEADGQLVLGRYRLLEALGRGGFGEVWRARDELLGREVAVKRIPLATTGGDSRATREAHAAARLAHPAIVALFEAFTSDGCFYLVSELVDGETLAALISADTLEDGDVLEIGLALTDALAHAHARGVVHRDIKPHNVLVPHSGEGAVAKLTDFGGASLAGEQALTRTGDVIGTLAYMAPEQSEGREAGPAADLYSLALVLYEGLSGVNPVRGATPAATARRIGQPLEPLARHRRDLPGPLAPAVDRALAADPAERGTLAELADALQDALEQLEQAPTARFFAGVTLPGPLVPPWRRRSRPPRRGEERELAALAAAAPADEDLDDALARDAPEQIALASEPVPAARASLPRRLWLAGALALAVWQAASGRAGVALLVLAAALPLLALPRRTGPGFLAAALAPALGLVGLAGCFPALAGQCRTWRERASLAALGYWWLVLAEPLLARRLWLGAPAGTPARSTWEGSPGTAAAHVIAPLFSARVGLAVALWALAAAVLPWIVRGRSAALDVVAAVMWTAATAATAQSLATGAGAAASHGVPRGLVLGAVLSALVAVGARAMRGAV